MANAPTGVLDDVYRVLPVVDFAGGRNTEQNPLTLPLNESPDQLNGRLSEPGRYRMRGGWLLNTTANAAGADGFIHLFDIAGNRRLLEFSDGKIYEVTGGIKTLKVSGAYTAGEDVAAAAYKGLVYWSDGIATLQKYDPVAGTNATVISSGAVGSVNPPAFKCITVYIGSLVVGAPTVGATYEPDGVRWCNVDDPTTWLGVSIQSVALGVGGYVNSVQNFGIADAGVSPFRALFVGKSQDGVFSYSGPLGTLVENRIQIPAGVLDGLSVKFVSASESLSGGIVFLGTDRRVWFTNGINSVEISTKIAREVSDLVLTNLASAATVRYAAVRNFADRQYVLDFGSNIQLAYHYNIQAWSRYEGWPSGLWAEAIDGTGAPAIYSASLIDGSTAFCNNGISDNGPAINVYWTTPYVHAGDITRWKQFDWLYVIFRTDVGQIEVTITEAITKTASGNLVSTFTYFPEPVLGGDVPFVLDSSELDSGDLFLDDASGVFRTYEVKERIACPVVAAAFGNIVANELMRAAAVQVKIGQSQKIARWELLGTQLLYLMRGHIPVG